MFDSLVDIVEKTPIKSMIMAKIPRITRVEVNGEPCMIY